MRRPSSSAAAGDEGHQAEPPRRAPASRSRNGCRDAASAGRGAMGEMVPSMSQNERGRAAAPRRRRARRRPAPRVPLMIGDPCLHGSPRSATPPTSVPAARAVVNDSHRGRSSSSSAGAAADIPGERDELTCPTTRRRPLPGGTPRDMRADPYLKSMLLGLIEDSYLHTGTFTQFAAEVLQVIAYAVTVPVAFTEGFLKAYLSIDRVVEEDDGRIKIIPKKGASIEDMIRDVDEITAQVDPGAVFNPVVRAKLDAVHQTSSKAMKWDLNPLSQMDDAQLMDVLREMQAESERRGRRSQARRDEATDACAPSSTPSAATCASSRRSSTRPGRVQRAAAAPTSPRLSLPPATAARRRRPPRRLTGPPRATVLPPRRARLRTAAAEGLAWSTSPTDSPSPSARGAASSASASTRCSSACRRRSLEKYRPQAASRRRRGRRRLLRGVLRRRHRRGRRDAACVKPQAAFFEQYGAAGWRALRHRRPLRPRVRPAGDPRRQARRHRLDRRRLRARRLRRRAGLRRRRSPASAPTRVTASPYLGDDSLKPLVDALRRRPRRLRPHAHQQPRRGAAAGARGRRPAAVPARRRPGRAPRRARTSATTATATSAPWPGRRRPRAARGPRGPPARASSWSRARRAGRRRGGPGRTRGRRRGGLRGQRVALDHLRLAGRRRRPPQGCGRTPPKPCAATWGRRLMNDETPEKRPRRRRPRAAPAAGLRRRRAAGAGRPRGRPARAASARGAGARRRRRADAAARRRSPRLRGRAAPPRRRRPAHRRRPPRPPGAAHASWRASPRRSPFSSPSSSSSAPLPVRRRRRPDRRHADADAQGDQDQRAAPRRPATKKYAVKSERHRRRGIAAQVQPRVNVHPGAQPSIEPRSTLAVGAEVEVPQARGAALDARQRAAKPPSPTAA